MAWHAVLTASAQNWSEVLYSSSIVLAASMRVRFFLSTTPFCCGVYGAENSCLIPSSSRNFSMLVFLNSLSLSLLILLIFTSNSFWALLTNFLKVSYTSLLSCKKNIQVKQE